MLAGGGSGRGGSSRLSSSPLPGGRSFLFGNTWFMLSAYPARLLHTADRRAPAFVAAAIHRTPRAVRAHGGTGQTLLQRGIIMAACGYAFGRAELGAAKRQLEKDSSSLGNHTSRVVAAMGSAAGRPDVSFKYRGVEYYKKVGASLKCREQLGSTRTFWTSAAGPGRKLSFSVEPWARDFSTSCVAPYSAGATERPLTMDNSTVTSDEIVNSDAVNLDIALGNKTEQHLKIGRGPTSLSQFIAHELIAYFMELFHHFLAICCWLTGIFLYRKSPAPQKLKLLSGSCYLPHPAKEATGGEDGHFICVDEQAIGVADGVGGWADHGVDAGLYAKELMSKSMGAIKDEPEGAIDPSRVLEKAFTSTKARGSSTACIITLKEQGLHAVNLGDSGFIVIRDGHTVLKSPSQQHDFNFTYQLESGGGSDLPSSADVFHYPVAHGDVIVAGTDGLFDNLYNNEIKAVVVEALRGGLGAQATAQKIAALARVRALDKHRQSPFAAAAQEAGYRFYGGKLDDITVVVSYVTSA